MKNRKIQYSTILHAIVTFFQESPLTTMNHQGKTTKECMDNLIKSQYEIATFCDDVIRNLESHQRYEVEIPVQASILNFFMMSLLIFDSIPVDSGERIKNKVPMAVNETHWCELFDS